MNPAGIKLSSIRTRSRLAPPRQHYSRVLQESVLLTCSLLSHSNDDWLIDSLSLSLPLSPFDGVGKTSTAMAVCRDLGFEIIEFNASDTRSKGALQV